MASRALREPIAVTLDTESQKLTGFIMQLNTVGILVELDRIPFKVGSFLTVSFTLDDVLLTERVRSIKHYDGFFRRIPKKKPEPNEALPTPKKLVEMHFQRIQEKHRVAIVRYFMKLKQAALATRRRSNR